MPRTITLLLALCLLLPATGYCYSTKLNISVHNGSDAKALVYHSWDDQKEHSSRYLAPGAGHTYTDEQTAWLGAVTGHNSGLSIIQNKKDACSILIVVTNEFTVEPTVITCSATIEHGNNRDACSISITRSNHDQDCNVSIRYSP